MMRKGIFAVIAVLIVLAMVMTGCPAEPGKTGPKKTTVTLEPSTLTLEIKEKKQIKATTDPTESDGKNLPLTWASSDKTVVTVNQGGYVEGIKEGTATITATAEDGGEGKCEITVTKAITNENDIKKVGETLEQYNAKLVGVNHFGTDLGTTNTDGSYTFDGTAAAWGGGGAQYNFPEEKANDTWRLSDYDLVEVHLKTTNGSVQVKSAKSGNNLDLFQYPATSSNNYTLNDTGDGKATYKFVIVEAGTGIGFQRNTGGPATVAIEKVIFSKATMRTITFTGLENAKITQIDPIKIPDGRTVNFGTGNRINYAMPSTPKYNDGTKHFNGWKNTTDNTAFNAATAITKDLTLEVIWEAGAAPVVDMHLNLDPNTWGTLPPHPNIANPGTLQSGSPAWDHPTNYAIASYNASTKVLTLEYDGKNRQRALIPLSNEQIDEIIYTDESKITFRIDADIAIGTTGIIHQGEFRCHLGDPTLGTGWNGSSDGSAETPLRDHLIEVRDIKSRTKNLLGFFMIQAMYKNPTTSATNEQFGFAPVTLTIRSISIDIGDTSATP